MSSFTRIMRGAMLLPLFALLLQPARSQEGQNPHSAIKPEPRKQQKGWMDRHAKFVARAEKGDVDVLFLGDSITQGWEGNGKEVWAKAYDGLKAANFGIGGDRTQHVLWRITEGKELVGIKPKVAVLMIGTNNMGGVQPTKDGKIGANGGNTASEIGDGVEAIVKELQKQLPEIKVLLLAIFPRAEAPTAPARAKIKEVNARLERFAKERSNVRYLDIGPKFLAPDGVLTKDIMPDYLHLSRQGYTIWAEAIDKDLKELLK